MRIIDVDGVSVECTEEGIHYTCYIRMHDIYFSTKIGDIEMVRRKTKAMIQSKENFLTEFPQYRK